MNLTHRGRADRSATRRLNRFSNRSCSCGDSRVKSGGQTFFVLYCWRGRGGAECVARLSADGGVEAAAVEASRTMRGDNVVAGRSSAGRKDGHTCDSAAALGRARTARLCSGTSIFFYKKSVHIYLWCLLLPLTGLDCKFASFQNRKKACPSSHRPSAWREEKLAPPQAKDRPASHKAAQRKESDWPFANRPASSLQYWEALNLASLKFRVSFPNTAQLAKTLLLTQPNIPPQRYALFHTVSPCNAETYGPGRLQRAQP